MIVDENLVPSIIKCMESEEHELTHNSAMILANISSINETNYTKLIVEHGAIPLIIK